MSEAGDTKGGPTGVRFRILDQSKLVKLLNWLEAQPKARVAGRFKNGHRVHATIGGLKHETRRAYKKGLRWEIDLHTFGLLEQAIKKHGGKRVDELKDTLYAAIETDRVAQRVIAHERWCEHQIRSFFERPGVPRFRRDQLGRTWVHESADHVEADALREFWSDDRRDAVNELLEAIEQDPDLKLAAGRRLHDLQDELLVGWGEARTQVAILRVVGPLLEAADSAFVEPHWREMDATTVAAIIDHGITRERLLLRDATGRMTDQLTRAQEGETPMNVWLGAFRADDEGPHAEP